MANITYGYARVSTKEQNQGRQLEALKQAGVVDKNIFTDKTSGKDFERTEYLKLKPANKSQAPK